MQGRLVNLVPDSGGWMLLLFGIAIAGFVAQLVDGALGMGFGNISTSLLLSLGLTPALASATSHTAEIATSGASGLSHWRLGNLDTKMLVLLAAPGAIGAFLGAVVLSNMSVEAAGPWVSSVLLLLGVTIVIRHVRDRRAQKSNRHDLPFVARHRWLLPPLGLVGGFLDASGGGGWGPVTTSTLMAAGTATPRKIIGSVDTAEWFVSVAAVVGFLISIGPEDVQWDIVIALMIGGVIAAPIAATIVQRAHGPALGTAVGGLVIVLSVDAFLHLIGIEPQIGFVVRVTVIAVTFAAVTYLIIHGRRNPPPAVVAEAAPAG
jgi:uncharacterized membrane protein YfcA